MQRMLRIYRVPEKKANAFVSKATVREPRAQRLAFVLPQTTCGGITEETAAFLDGFF